MAGVLVTRFPAPALPECVLRGSLRSHLSMRRGEFATNTTLLMLRCEAVRPSLEARTLRLQAGVSDRVLRENPGPSTGPLGEPREAIPLAPDQSFLLGPAPALDAPLGGDCIGNPFEVLVENEPHGPAGARVAAERPGLMLVEALVEIILHEPSRRSSCRPRTAGYRRTRPCGPRRSLNDINPHPEVRALDKAAASVFRRASRLAPLAPQHEGLGVWLKHSPRHAGCVLRGSLRSHLRMRALVHGPNTDLLMGVWPKHRPPHAEV